MANKKKTRPNILIDEDCYLSIKNLNKEDFYNLFMSVLEFGFERKEPKNLSGALEATYLLITKKMQRAQNRYDICVKNGSKGGAPSGNQNAKKASEEKTTRIQPENNQKYNQNSTRIQPKAQPEFNQKTTLKTTKPSIETEIPNDNLNKNIFSLSCSEGARATQHTANQREPYLPESYSYHKNDEFGKSIEEIIDTLLDAVEFAKTNETITYNSATYSAEQIIMLVNQYGKDLANSLAYKLAKDTRINNKSTYILGCLINKANQE